MELRARRTFQRPGGLAPAPQPPTQPAPAERSSPNESSPRGGRKGAGWGAAGGPPRPQARRKRSLSAMLGAASVNILPSLYLEEYFNNHEEAAAAASAHGGGGPASAARERRVGASRGGKGRSALTSFQECPSASQDPATAVRSPFHPILKGSHLASFCSFTKAA